VAAKVRTYRKNLVFFLTRGEDWTAMQRGFRLSLQGMWCTCANSRLLI
jgi:hypothetical protein